MLLLQPTATLVVEGYQGIPLTARTTRGMEGASIPLILLYCKFLCVWSAYFDMVYDYGNIIDSPAPF